MSSRQRSPTGWIVETFRHEAIRNTRAIALVVGNLQDSWRGSSFGSVALRRSLRGLYGGAPVSTSRLYDAGRYRRDRNSGMSPMPFDVAAGLVSAAILLLYLLAALIAPERF